MATKLPPQFTDDQLDQIRNVIRVEAEPQAKREVAGVEDPEVKREVAKSWVDSANMQALLEDIVYTLWVHNMPLMSAPDWSRRPKA